VLKKDAGGVILVLNGRISKTAWVTALPENPILDPIISSHFYVTLRFTVILSWSIS
jgi:hypothetical protein